MRIIFSPLNRLSDKMSREKLSTQEYGTLVPIFNLVNKIVTVPDLYSGKLVHDGLKIDQDTIFLWRQIFTRLFFCRKIE